MSLTKEDKKWLVRLAQITVYLIQTHLTYAGYHIYKKTMKNHFAELLKD
jgi:hypothetical protein